MINEMKSVKFGFKFLSGFALSAIVLASCAKENTSSEQQSISNEEATEIVSSSMGSEAGGMSSQMTWAFGESSNKTDSIVCGATYTNSISGNNAAGSIATWNYVFAQSYILNCLQGFPISFDYSYAGEIHFSGPKLDYDDEVDASMSISGFLPSDSVFTVTQSYDREGSKTWKVGNQKQVQAHLIINVNALYLNKITHQIISGTGTFSLNGSTTNIGTFNYSGSLTFLGGNQVQLNFSNGFTTVITI